MFYVLVKFKSEPVPTVWGVSHIRGAAKLATMEGIDWVSPVISQGAVIECKSDLGGNHRITFLGEHAINGYKPKDD